MTAAAAFPRTAPVLDVRNLTVELALRSGSVRAVEDVSFAVQRGRIVGIVGESGSGKSTTALALLGLGIRGARIAAGSSIRLDGRDIVNMSDRELREARGAAIGLVRQNPRGNLNPVLTVGRQLREAIQAHSKQTRSQARERSIGLLDAVRLPEPEQVLGRYPHELSGGMCQRVAIALAIASSPAVLVADEATSSLDATVQREILTLLRRLCTEREMSIVLISHDLSVMAEVADDIIVMYGGRIVEDGTSVDILGDPRHPYTAALLQATPSIMGDRSQPLAAIPGAPPEITSPLPGCPYHPRCSRRFEPCDRLVPALTPVGLTREVACWLYPADESVTGGSDDVG